MRRILKMLPLSKSGSSIIEILISLALVLIISTGGYAITQSYSKSTKQLVLVQGVMQFRRTIVDSLRSSDALVRISALPANSTVPNIGCFATLQSCGAASTAFVPFSIADISGNYMTRHDQANFGFDIHQATCTTFPSAACPYRIQLEWASLCNAGRPGSCNTPQLIVRGTLQTATNASIQIPPQNFSFSQTLSKYIGSYEQSCTSLGGTYIASTPPRCSLPSTGDCPPDGTGNPQIVVGYDRIAGNMICRPYFSSTLNNGACADGFVIVATSSVDGSPVCKPIALAPPPGPTPIPFCDANPTHPSCAGVIPAFPGD